MYNHAPENYDCPFCFSGGKDEKERDIFYRDDFVTAVVSSKWWPKNAGGTIIVPNKHYENVYDLPNELGHKIFDVSKKVTIALKEVYHCDGVSMRQHNEPAGNQDVWHYHLHIIPRYIDDELYVNHKKSHWTTAEERAPYVKKLREYFHDNNRELH